MPRILPVVNVQRAQFGVRDTPFHQSWPGFGYVPFGQTHTSGTYPLPATSYLHRFDFGFFVLDVTVRA
jgi:hypothetical protein